MKKKQSIHLPIITSSKLMNYFHIEHEECDCACPDDGFTFSLQTSQSESSLRWPSLSLMELPEQYTLLFNSMCDSGVVVLNDVAAKVWKQFQVPESPKEIQGELIQKMLDLGILEPVGSHTVALKGTPRTLSAWLHVTNNCNLLCDYCYINKSTEKMSLEVGYASVDAIIRAAIYGHFKGIKIKYSGGEATLNIKLVFLLDEYARNKSHEAGLKYEAILLSNGIALSESAIKELAVRNIRLMISLDGLGDFHDSQRKFLNSTGSFAQVNHTLDKLIALRVKPLVSITVTDRNVAGLPDVVKYLLDRNLPFNINFYRDIGCAKSPDDLCLSDNEMIDSLKRAFSIIESQLPNYSLLGMLVDRSSFSHAHERTCSVGEAYMVIDHHGRIAKCHMEIEKSITNVSDENPLDLIRRDSLGIQNVSVDEKEECQDCKWKYWCTGGCPLLTFRVTGRYDTKSPYCRIYKAIYPELIRLEGLRLIKMVNQTPPDDEMSVL